MENGRVIDQWVQDDGMARPVRPPKYVYIAVNKWGIDGVIVKGKCVRVGSESWFGDELKSGSE